MANYRLRIGADPAPSWSPTSGEFKQISYNAGSHPSGLGATLGEIETGTQSWNPDAPAKGPYGGASPSDYFFNTMRAYCGALLNTDLDIYHDIAAGHNAFNVGIPFGFRLGTLRWEWYGTPLPTDGLYKPRVLGGFSSPFSEAQMETYYPTKNNHPTLGDWQFDYDWGDWSGDYSGWPVGFDRPGTIQPEPGHSRATNCFIPAALIGNTNGMTLMISSATGSNSGSNSTGTHLFDWDDNEWYRTANRPNQVAGVATLDTLGARVLVAGTGTASGTLTAIRIFDAATKTWLSNCACTSGPYFNNSIDAVTFTIHEASDLLVCLVTSDDANAENSNSPTKQRMYVAPRTSCTPGGSFAWTLVTLSNPGGTWPTGDTGLGGNGWCGSPLWHPNTINSNLYTVNGKNGSTLMWKITPPSAVDQAGYISGTWTVSEVTMTTGSLYHRNSSDTTTLSTRIYNKLQWHHRSSSYIWGSDSVNGIVQAIRPSDF